MNIRINLKDLIKDAHYEQYSDISDTTEQSERKKPLFYFSIIQFIFIGISLSLCFLLPSGFSTNFAGYAISGLALFVGLFFTYVLTLLDKIHSVDFSKYNKKINADKYPIGVRLKNYFKKITVLSHYAIVISILCIMLLSMTVLFDEILSVKIDFCNIACNFNKLSAWVIVKTILILLYRALVVYFLLDFLLVTIYIVSSSYDYTISELNKIKLS